MNKERKEAKLKLEGARSERLKQRWREEYDAKNNEVKRSVRENKRIWLEKRAAAEEKPLRMVGARSYTALLIR